MGVSKAEPNSPILRERSGGQLKTMVVDSLEKASISARTGPTSQASARYSPEAEDLGAARS